MTARRRSGCLGIAFAIWLPALYLALAAYAWVDFARASRDGLANLGLFLVTFPVALLDAILSGPGRPSVLLPQGHGYLADHALYFIPATLVTAVLFWAIGRALDRFRAKREDR